MLFPYIYVPHKMEKMQSFVDFIFYAVWCQAPSKGAYCLELFASNPDLFEVMLAFHYDDSKGAQFFAGHVERIYGLFAQLNPCQIEQLRLWYRANNDIERVCAACHHCNSSYKTSKDIAHPVKDPAGIQVRRRAFYPYSNVPYQIKISFNLDASNLASLEPKHVSLQFGPAVLQEQIDTWRDVYGIDERYKAKVCGENDGKYWLEQVLGEWREMGRDPQELLSEIRRSASRRPYGECNFLKAPFLSACDASGAFS